jgi:type VI secretion system protein ImpK
VPIAPGETAAPGLSPLVQAASPLLQLAAHIRGTLGTPDVAALRQLAMEEIRRFEAQSRQSGIASEVVLAARYAICAVLDEAVLSTPWGSQSEWAQQTLLNALHREAWGGKKFFEMLERISKDPTRYRDLMEVQYLCLAFGFAGQYRVQDQGATRLADIQHEIFRRIQPPDATIPGELSLRWRGVEDRRNRLVRYAPGGWSQPARSRSWPGRSRSTTGPSRVRPPRCRRPWRGLAKRISRAHRRPRRPPQSRG